MILAVGGMIIMVEFISLMFLSKLVNSVESKSTQFLVLGDWGGGVTTETNISSSLSKARFKTGNALQMKWLWEEHLLSRESEVNRFFVISTGDNFYRKGVTGVKDQKWQTDFSEPFAGVKCDWFPVLGKCVD